MKLLTHRWIAAAVLAALVLVACHPKQQNVFDLIKDKKVAAQLKTFIANKEAQANKVAAIKLHEFPQFIAAAKRGDWLTVSNLDVTLQREYETPGGANRIAGEQWTIMKEIWGALNAFSVGSEKYSTGYSREIIDSVPAGSVYFGGTDAGLYLITAMQKSHEKGDPFFTLTQNGLCDGSYLDYARSMYGDKIYIPDDHDSQRCYEEYLKDAQLRLRESKLYPGESVQETNGRVQVAGQISVMEINALLAKVVFERNTNREFYVEESFPLDWMYPHLEPHGLIFKLNHEPFAELSDESLKQDCEYWKKLIAPMIGGWLTETTSVQEIGEFAKRVFLHKDFAGYSCDPRFVENRYACSQFSKERSSIGGLFAWRLGISPSNRLVPDKYLPQKEVKRNRLIDAADFAYRQSWALCPYSPEAIYRYVAFLTNQRRFDDAIILVDTALALSRAPADELQLQDLSSRLRQAADANKITPPQSPTDPSRR